MPKKITEVLGLNEPKLIEVMEGDFDAYYQYYVCIGGEVNGNFVLKGYPVKSGKEYVYVTCIKKMGEFYAKYGGHGDLYAVHVPTAMFTLVFEGESDSVPIPGVRSVNLRNKLLDTIDAGGIVSCGCSEIPCVEQEKILLRL